MGSEWAFFVKLKTSVREGVGLLADLRQNYAVGSCEVAPVLRHPWPSLLFYYCESLFHVKEGKNFCLFLFYCGSRICISVLKMSENDIMILYHVSLFS